MSKRARRARRRRAARATHPDEEHALAAAADALGAVLGAEVTLAPKGAGYRAEIAFESLEEIHELARRAARRPAAA